MIVMIPTKARPATQTYKLLEASGFMVYHFIEPQDVKDYKVPNIVDIGADNKGISFVRNYMLNWARSNGHTHAIICDDDFDHFGTVKDKKSVREPNADALIKPFKVFCSSSFALAGINQRQFAWSETKPYKVNNGKMNGCIFINLKKTLWNYKDNTKEDLDFAMQCLDNSHSFIYFCKTFYNTPAIGSNSGGLHDLYSNNADSSWARNLNLAWPKYSKIIKQYGRIDCRVDFKSLAKDKGLDVK